MDLIRERRELRRILGEMPRSPKQTNGLFEADAEILRLGPREWLVSSTDSIGEEVTLKLYREPETWGWMSVMSSVSDLAATGTSALGLLLSAQWAFQTKDPEKKRFYKGVRQALQRANVPLLGGDSGGAKDHVFTTTILGRSSTEPISRMGAKPGDAVVLLGLGQLGPGPALAFRYLYEHPEKSLPEKLFRPTPNWSFAEKWRDVASASIDTSDGLATSLAILGSLNQVGFDLEWQPSALHPAVVRFCRQVSLPLPLLWMGDHGDFQTLLCVPQKKLARMQRRYDDFVVLGKVTDHAGHVSLKKGAQSLKLPVDWVVNCKRDLPSIRELSDEMVAYFRQ